MFGELPVIRAACVPSEPFGRIIGDLLSFRLCCLSEGIEKVEIVQMDNAVMATPERKENALDITVTCQGR